MCKLWNIYQTVQKEGRTQVRCDTNADLMLANVCDAAPALYQLWLRI